MALGTLSHAGMGDDPLLSMLTIDELEKQGNDEKNIAWDTNLWIGHDLNKIYFYTEGEKPKDGTAESENQLVYSRAIAPFGMFSLVWVMTKQRQTHKHGV